MDEAYAKLLDQAGAADAWNQKFRPVLGPLAVAGAGSFLPLSLLAHASKTLDGLEGVEDVRDVLARLRGLVVRRDAGETIEHVGLFHTTLADYLLGPSASRAGYTLDAEAAHRAMVQAIEALAPMDKHDRDDPLHRYAFLREADHLWALGDTDRTLACLRNREANIPSENLERLRPWLSRLRSRFAEDHPTILDLRDSLACWTGQAGDARGRCGCSRSCCRTGSASWARPPRHAHYPQQHRGLDRPGGRRAGAAAVHGAAAGPGAGAGRDHPDTLISRNNIATWTGHVGDARGALRLLTELLPDQERVLGRDHPDTLISRNNIASLTGRAGDARGRCGCSRSCCRTGSASWAQPRSHARDP